jgi:hypothetical protein
VPGTSLKHPWSIFETANPSGPACIGVAAGGA